MNKIEKISGRLTKLASALTFRQNLLHNIFFKKKAIEISRKSFIFLSLFFFLSVRVILKIQQLQKKRYL